MLLLPNNVRSVLLATREVVRILRKHYPGWPEHVIPGIILYYICEAIENSSLYYHVTRRRRRIFEQANDLEELEGMEESFFLYNLLYMTRALQWHVGHEGDGNTEEDDPDIEEIDDPRTDWLFSFPENAFENVVEWWVRGARRITAAHALYSWNYIHETDSRQQALMERESTAKQGSAGNPTPRGPARAIMNSITQAEELGLAHLIPHDALITIESGRIAPLEAVLGSRLETKNHLETHHRRALVDERDEQEGPQHEEVDEMRDQDRGRGGGKKRAAIVSPAERERRLACALRAHYEEELCTAGGRLKPGVSKSTWSNASGWSLSSTIKKRLVAKKAGLIECSPGGPNSKTWKLTPKGIAHYKRYFEEHPEQATDSAA